MTEIPNLPPIRGSQPPQPPSQNLLASYLGKAGFILFIKHTVNAIIQQMHQGEQMWKQGEDQIKKSI